MQSKDAWGDPKREGGWAASARAWWDRDVTHIDDARIPDGVPRDLPIEVRDAVRLVIVDPAGRILLFRARHTVYPELNQWWELPGGGMEPGESHESTAIREAFEETGIRIEPRQLSRANWRRIATYKSRTGRRVQYEAILTARLDESVAVDVSGQLDYELEDYTSSRWLSLDEIRGSRERFYPGRLPELIDAHLRGDDIDEGLEIWS